MGAWLGALVLLGSWWLASSNAPPVARQLVPPLAERPAPPSPRASAFSERLKRGLQRAPSKPASRRNPFAFATDERRGAAASASTPLVEVAPAPIAPPPRPLYVLAGIATTETPEGPVRTAVISTPTGILLLKIDEATPTGLRVVRIGEDHVVLADAEGNEATLRLK